ncbi:unnamed protein product [Porites lobata]|uniref:Uncharacterized protein n=1 Tax=Porites lobata TaxID=104759 RepID=A0ABN8R4D3_9CNID|nr:unnamed protein product [Porites lobata]
MKTFIAVLLLTACAAYVTAEHMAFHKAVFQFLDKRHDERMTRILRDNGLPEDTIPANDHQEKSPEWMKPCIETAKESWKNAGHDACKRLACIDNFFECIKKSHPTPLPSLPPLQKGCVFLLYMCRKQSPTCAGELCCFVRIKRCFKAVAEH